MNPINADYRTTTLKVLAAVTIVLYGATPETARAADTAPGNSGVPLSLSNLQTQVSALQSEQSLTQKQIEEAQASLAAFKDFFAELGFLVGSSSPPTPPLACETGYEPLEEFIEDGSPVFPTPSRIGCQQNFDGATRVISVYITDTAVHQNGTSLEPQCPAPFVVTGGGFKGNNALIVESIPVLPQQRWRVSARGGEFEGYGLTAYAVCTQLDP